MIEIWRFVSAIMILFCHLYYVGVEGDYPFSATWIFVEFFFILTGFLTARHFWVRLKKINAQSASGEPEALCNASQKLSFKQLWREFGLFMHSKVVHFLPLTTLAILIQYVLEYAYRRNEPGFSAGKFWGELPMDLIYISDFFEEPKDVPLWYISAILWTFPIIFLILWIPRRNLRMVISLIIPIGFYLYAGVENHRHFPWDYLRSLSGMLIGIFVFDVVVIIRKYCSNKEIYTKQSKLSMVLLSALEFLTLLIPIVTVGLSIQNQAGNLVCFAIGVVLIGSNLTVTQNLSGQVLDYLGRLSIHIFIWQWVVGTAVWCLDRVVGYFVTGGLPLTARVLIYIFGTVITAVTADFVYIKLRLSALFTLRK